MLTFFIHGVATRAVTYADPLKQRIKTHCQALGHEAPYCYASFWGNALSDVEQMWRWIDADLRCMQASEQPINTDDYLRYRSFREGFLSEFVGDMFTYLNPKRGLEIRRILAQQLSQFVQEYPRETSLSLVAHSLGTVILWDVLFANRFPPNDPAWEIRAIAQGQAAATPQLSLTHIVTMGSPILFFNTMLGIQPRDLQTFVNAHSGNQIRWLNLIHPSDLIAYPLKSSISTAESAPIHLQDVYVDTMNHLPARTARSLGQPEVAMVLDAGPAHNYYWDCSRTAQLIAQHFTATELTPAIAARSGLEEAIQTFQTVPGMTLDKLRLHIGDRPETTIQLADGSGTILHVINMAKIHHVYILDRQNICQFSGYVGWTDTQHLLTAMQAYQS